ncbi:tail fiber protein [Bacillus phage G]|uniref:Gp530 n=1 Tax=Bacillus phage G TaxID=2884420 RepID=G3MAS1_9CAUD|nr:tail fiber protein [Bacillus phage G]AEO93788.1 gp530 [Bacillus phage G]
MGIRKMSIQEGLNELKVLESRITKLLAERNTYVSVVIGDRSVRGYENNAAFEKKAKAKFDSIAALIERRTVVKNAIIKKNAEVQVEINGKTMTLAEAINYKTFIEEKKRFLSQLVSQYNTAMNQLENEEYSYKEKLDKHVETMVGSDRKDKMKENEEVIKFFKESNEPKLIDPVGLKDVIDKLTEEIEGFEAKVDFELTRANITNDIEFEDPTVEDPKPKSSDSDLPGSYQ